MRDHEDLEKVPSFQESVGKIVQEFGHAEHFPPAVEQEAQRIPAEIAPDSGGDRVDLRDEIVVTIDGDTARDFDDAISIRHQSNGTWLLKVSIADVSWYVRSGSAIDREAHQRATSVYLPDRCVPMLPERLSNDLCSLVPKKDRLTMTAEMEFDAAGTRTGSRFYRSIIRSRERLTYRVVEGILVRKDEELKRRYQEVLPTLDDFYSLYQVLRRSRLARGSLDFDLPEPEIVLDMETGAIEEIIKAERLMSCGLIEEFMIAANEAVAERIEQSGRPSLYRIHQRPDAVKVGDFLALLHNLGISVKMPKKMVPQAFSSLLQAIKGRPEERLLNTLLLRTMKQAVYDVSNDGHFGLASTCYTHFTSPIRRYPDLVVHRILGDLITAHGLRQPPPAPSFVGRGINGEALSKVAVHCSERERNAMKTEWAARDLAACHFVSGKVGETHEGVISNVTSFGFFVGLTSIFVEGLVGMRSLRGDYYVYEEKRQRLVGRKSRRKFQLGDAVRVVIQSVNLNKRWIDFSLAELG